MDTQSTPRLVFMDLEGTLVRGNAIRPFVDEGRKLGIFTRRGLLQAQLVGLLSQVVKPAKGNLRFLAMRRLVAGRPVADIERAGAAWQDVILANLKQPIAARLRAYNEAGIPVYLLSGALHDGMESLARTLGAAGGEGSKVTQRDGRYTGEAASLLCQSEEKAQRARAIAAHLGIPLAECAAYSDALVDLPLLRLVGQPIVVDPELALRDIATREGWQIIETGMNNGG